MNKGILILLLGAVTSCQSTHDGFGYRKKLHPADVRHWQADLINHDEPGWDRLGLWRRLEGSPPSYVPKDLPRHAPVDHAHGTWIVDAADQSRFYVPKGGTPHYSEGVLRAEADKVTNKVSKYHNRIGNALGMLICWPIVTSLTFIQEGARNM